MRIKSIVSLIAFFSAFIFSVMLIGLPKDNGYSRLTERRTAGRQQQNIRTILWADINRGRERDRELSEINGVGERFQTAANVHQIADLTEEYVDGSQSMDVSNLPADFREAWQAHMNAWRVQANYYNEISAVAQTYQDETVDASKVNGRLFKIDSELYQNQSDEINQTWYEVLRIARKYGVYVPVQ